MARYVHDDGDMYDQEKWDFDERGIPVHWVGKYPYKARNKENALRLANFRNKIDMLCHNLVMNKQEWENSTSNISYLNGVAVFLGLHMETIHDPSTLPHPFYDIAMRGSPTSRYLLSEIPKGTAFAGLNKPKMRYMNKRLPKVGKDGSGRALYRDIFLDLNKSDRALKNLIIHELAHSMANHIAYRPDDHHADFKWAERLIADYWPE